MTLFGLRLLMLFAVLTSPVMAAEASFSALNVTQASGLSLEDTSREACPLKPSFCALCAMCLSAVPAAKLDVETTRQAERFVLSEDALVGLLSVTIPIPP